MPQQPVGQAPREQPHCGIDSEPDGDEQRTEHLPATTSVGDIICTPVTGAYGYSMASNYNLVPRAAVVFVADGKAQLTTRRETLDDLFVREIDPV